ncbi:MAG: helix-turn-helix domain-containing protein [Ruminococcaceae bacterium]|nr:helix-turn-helix domain-containing protein [Oscillospiraceae bacterium]
MLLNVRDVMTLLGIPESSAYKLISQLNSELKDQGYITLRAKINKNYLLERLGLMQWAEHNNTEN